MDKTNEMYFEDFTIGRIFKSESIYITKSEIIDYAHKFDPQFFHLDEEAAKNSVFGTLVASGWHTASLSMRLFVQACGNIHGGMIGRGVEKIEWPRPTYPEDILTITCEVISTKTPKSRPDLGIVNMHNITRNQDNKPVMIADIVMFVPKK